MNTPGGRHSSVVVSIVVVTFHTDPAMLAAAVSSAVASAVAAGARAEVVIVDNTPGGQTLPELVLVPAAGSSPVRVLRSGRNAGFGAAVNAGVDVASGDVVFCVNPDTVTSPGALTLLLDVLAAPGRRLLVGWLTSDGCAQPDASLLWMLSTSRLLRRPGHIRRLAGSTGPGPVPLAKVSGGALFARTSDLRALRFDERFFLYGEDADLSVRARAAGFALQSVPDAVVEHAGATSMHEHGALVERARVDAALRLVAHHHRSWLPVAFLELWMVTRLGLLAVAVTSSPTSTVRRARLRELRRWQGGWRVPPVFDPAALR